jgi:hypothetical protein
VFHHPRFGLVSEDPCDPSSFVLREFMWFHHPRLRLVRRIHGFHHPRWFGVALWKDPHPRPGLVDDSCGFIIPGWFSFRGFIWFRHSRYDLL